VSDLRQYLDGDWAFLPEIHGNPSGADAPPPVAAFEPTPIHVPGCWRTFPPDLGGDWDAYQCYRYPSHWQEAAAAWYRRTFRVAPGRQREARCILNFDAVLGAATVWLNGRRFPGNVDSFLPFAFDVTDHLRPDADNELVVRVDPPPTAGGLWLQPCGSWFGWYMRGIWQPVWLEFRPAVAITDVFVQPSVRSAAITVDVTVSAAARGGSGRLAARITSAGRSVLDLGERPIAIAAGESQTVRFTRSWSDPRCWSPDDPHLYHAEVRLECADSCAHTRSVRFGFREFWIDGLGFRLNGRPIRLFGDSWHYMGPLQQNPAYARAWFRLARETGVNAIRTHAMPFPPFYFDIADEMGLLIVDESAIYGSAGTLAFDEPRFWDNCREHVRRLVLRDRNHPAIIFWSACNETVWKGGDAIFAGLLSLAEVAQAHDPTRFVSFDENDCDIGGKARLHAGHYGTPAHWQRSWKRDRPLIVHEFSAFYHGGPESVCHLGDDAVYRDYLARLRCTGDEAAEMFLRLRSLGAAAITPWNVVWYCGTPLPRAAVETVDPQLTAGGQSLDRFGERSLTLNFGFAPDDPAFVPNPGYAAVQACYRRRRFFVPVRPAQAFAASTVDLHVEIWNDLDETLDARLTLTLERGAARLGECELPVQLTAWGQAQHCLAIAVPALARTEALTARLVLAGARDGAELHAETWTLHVHPRTLDADPDEGEPPRRALFVASAPIADLPAEILHPDEIADGRLERLTNIEDATLLLAAPHAGRTLADWLNQNGLQDWLRDGGRIVVLPGGVADDACSVLAGQSANCTQIWPRDAAGGVIHGLTAEHFCNWPPQGTVAHVLYPRPTTGPAWSPLDVGDPAAGLASTPLLVVPLGLGQIVVCGMDLLVRRADTPAAAILLERLLHEPLPTEPAAPAAVVAPSDATFASLTRCVGVCDRPDPVLLMFDGSDPAGLADDRAARAHLVRHLAVGGLVWIDMLTPQTAATWSQRLDLPLELAPDERCNLARAGDHDLLAGLNNFDFCWVLRGEKQRICAHTLAAGRPEYETLVETVATRWEDYQLAAEQHKVAMMYRRLDAFAGPRAALVLARRGMGKIIISQLALRAAQGMFLHRAQRILSRLLDNLGAQRAPAVSLLAPRPRPVVDADGFITGWLALGPFTTSAGHPLDHPFVDESTLDPRVGKSQGGCAWRNVASAFPQVDLAQAFAAAPERDRVAYLAVRIHSPQDRSVLLDAPDMICLRMGADGGIKPFLNGNCVGRFDFLRALVIDSDRVDGLPLRRGENLLVIKLHNPSGPWRFAARLVTASGAPPRDLTFG